MRRIQLGLVTILALLAGAWWSADATNWSTLGNPFAWRAPLMQASGVLAIGLMSVALILALRLPMLERVLGGLDKVYRLHKWLGIAALLCSVAHWAIDDAPKWAVSLGLLERPARGPRPVIPPDTLEYLLSRQRDWAGDIGESAFNAVVVLVLLALWRRFPYRWFFATHRLIAVVYLALVLHSVVLLRFAYWSTPLGGVMAALMAAGSAAAVVVLLRRVGVQRQVTGEVEQFTWHEDLQVLRLTVMLKGRWPGHEAGQFAFLTLHEREGAHPFTMTSAWRHDGRIEFAIKALGDYTRALPGRIAPRQLVKLEGPYGRFNFDGASKRQIWIGAGIGITPFVARMKALAESPDGRQIDLFHTTPVLDAPVIALLERDARDAGVNLHVLWDERDGLLDAPRLMQAVPHWCDADVWFCGPTGFADTLRNALVQAGLPERRFHQELFELR
jgi:predicted ferric reductase